MLCHKCGVENVDHARYCRRCGTALKPVSRVTKAQLEGQIVEKDAELALMKEQISILEKKKQEIDVQNKKNLKKISNLQKKIGSLSQPAAMSSDTTSSESNTHVRLNFFCIFVVVVLVLICISQCEAKKTVIQEKSNLSAELSSVKRRNNQLEKTFLDIGHIQPVFVSKIEIRNEGENYDSIIYSKNTTFINLRVSTISLANKDVDVFVKMIKPNGEVSRGTDSPKGYSYKRTVHAKKGEAQTTEFNGWGNKTRGHWPAGKYKFELYVGGRMIGEKELIVK